MSQLTVVITTRNRWTALSETLGRLAALRPDVPVLLVDDGSDQPASRQPSELHPAVEFHREGDSRGLIVRRNELNARARTPFVLSLDDDSYPVSEDLERALAPFADDRVHAVSLPVFNPVTGLWQNAGRPGAPSPCRAFVGCAHIVRREAFLELGGYTELLVHQGEEHDLGARAFKRGWKAMHCPDVVVHHLESPEGRNLARMDYYGARNAVLWNDWYVPDGQQSRFRRRRWAATGLHALRTRRTGQIRGHLAARDELDALADHRDRMDEATFARWRALPFA